MTRRLFLPLALLGAACATSAPAGKPGSSAMCLPCAVPCTPESSCGAPPAAAVARAAAPAPAPTPAPVAPPAPKKPEAPTLSPDAGTFASSQEVTISTPAKDALIHYTTDGSEPTEASPIYSGPIAVDRTTTVKAVAMVAGAPPSEVASAAYTIAPPPKAPVATPRVTVTKDKLVLAEKVYFDTAKATIKPVSHSLLDEVAAALASRQDVKKVRIEGHTDAAGDAAFNQKLSQRRAEAVREFLVKKGIEPARLEAKGFGANNPVAPNTTPKGRESNRRVDFVVE